MPWVKDLQIHFVNNLQLCNTRLSGTSICCKIFLNLNVVSDRKIKSDLKLFRFFFLYMLFSSEIISILKKKILCLLSTLIETIYSSNHTLLFL